MQSKFFFREINFRENEFHEMAHCAPTTIPQVPPGANEWCLYVSNYAVWPFLDDPTTEENLAEKECQKIGLSLANIDPLALAAVQELSSMYCTI